MLSQDGSLQVTEASNPLSEGLDLESPVDALNTIHRCEMEMFGNSYGQGVYGSEFVDRATDLAARLKQQPNLPVLLAGAGTSGRLCRLIALERPDSTRDIRSALPGGTPALAKAKPLGEDYRSDGADAAKFLLAETPPGCFAIGVTCGLTAKYVEGFVDEARKNRGAGATAILGFNPSAAARIDLFPTDRGTILLNPILGAEAVRGSVRMKSGTATLAILRSVLTPGAEGVLERLREVEGALDEIRSVHDFAAELVAASAMSIRNGGHVFLIGEGPLGALGMFDAAECVPTFSADPKTCRGFVGGGWTYFDTSSQAPKIYDSDVSISHFLDEIVPRLGCADTVIVIAGRTEGLAELVLTVSNAGARFVIDAGGVLTSGPIPGVRCSGRLNSSGWPRLIAIRSLLGRISTAAFASSGSLFGNRMIDLRITNRKLLRRATLLVGELGGVEPGMALDAIVRAHGEVSGAWPTDMDTDDFIRSVTTEAKLIRRALLLMAEPGMSASRALEIASAGIPIRSILPSFPLIDQQQPRRN